MQVWLSFAQFEATLPGIGPSERVQRTRQVYENADDSVKRSDDKAERLMLLESWLAFEVRFGSLLVQKLTLSQEEVGESDHIEAVKAKMPKKIKKRREVFDEDGVRVLNQSSRLTDRPGEHRLGRVLRFRVPRRAGSRAQPQASGDRSAVEGSAGSWQLRADAA